MGECLLVRRGGSAAKIETALRENLLKMGVTAPDGASVDELVAYVLSIPQGDISQQYFVADMDGEKIAPTYGYYAFDEESDMSDSLTISGMNKMAKFCVLIEGEGAEDLTYTAPGWSTTKTEGAVTLTRTIGSLENRFTIMDSFETVQMAGTKNTKVKMTAYAIGADGTRYDVEGSAELRFQSGSWELLEAKGITWGQAANMTWDELENMTKI